MMEFLRLNAVLWPVAVPLIAAALTACLWNLPRAQKAVSMAAAAVMFAASILLLWAVDGQGVQVARFGSWAAPFGIVFAADRFSAAMACAASLVALSALVFGLSDIKRREARAGFHPLFQGMLAGINGAFLTGDLFNLYVWFEIMLITAMGLLVIGRTRAQLDGTLRYAGLNLVSTILFLLAVGLLYGVTGTLNMADLSLVVRETEPSATLTISAVLLLCGFGIKAGFFPLFFWLPASYHTGSITVQAVFAGLLTKVGVYACLRVFTLILPVSQNGIGEILAVLAAGTMIVGVLGALAHTDLRRILGYQIVSQLGFMLVGLAIATPLALASAIFYILQDIVVKANLFLVAGAVNRAGGTYDLGRAGGLAARSPLLALLFVLPALSLAGMPPFSGFVGKVLVVDAALAGGAAWLAAVALAVGFLNLFSMSRIWLAMFWKTSPLPRPTARPVPSVMLVPIAVLGAATLLIGVAAEPVVAFTRAAANDLADPSAYIAAVLGDGVNLREDGRP